MREKLLPLILLTLPFVGACADYACSAVYYSGKQVAHLDAPVSPYSPSGPGSDTPLYTSDKMIGATVTVCHVDACATVTVDQLDVPVPFAGEITGSVTLHDALPALTADVDFHGRLAPDHYDLRVVAADGSLVFDQHYAATYYDPEESDACGAPYQARVTQEN